MSKPLEAGFLLQPVDVAVERLLPSTKLPDGFKTTPRYQTIAASVREIGIIAASAKGRRQPMKASTNIRHS